MMRKWAAPTNHVPTATLSLRISDAISSQRFTTTRTKLDNVNTRIQNPWPAYFVIKNKVIFGSWNLGRRLAQENNGNVVPKIHVFNLFTLIDSELYTST